MEVVWITGGAMIALLVFATLYKYVELRRAAGWQTVPGRIVSSRSRARKMRTSQTHDRALGGSDHHVRNFAEITYEYRVDGRTYRGQRIGIGEDLGDHGVESRLARYPVGAAVTVHYDPADPGQAVLETDAPEGIWRTMAIFIGVLVLLLVGGVFGFDAIVDRLGRTMSQPERALPAVALWGLAGFLALMARAAARQAEAARAWPTTEGVIESSEVDTFQMRRPDVDEHHRSRRVFRPDIVYRYRVGGVELKGSRLRLGGRVYASFDRLARNDVETYPPGRRVTVFYNPDNASEAVLEPVAQGLWLAWGLAALLATGALLITLG